MKISFYFQQLETFLKFRLSSTLEAIKIMQFEESKLLKSNEMKIFPILDLPDDILLYLFEFLDKGALKRVSRVCQRFRNLIVNSKTLTERITLFFQTKDTLYSEDEYKKMFQKFLENEAAEFPYKSLKVQIDKPQEREIWENLTDIFMKFVKNPLKIGFSSVPIPVVNNFMKINSSTLTHLNLFFNDYLYWISDMPYEFPNLISLELLNCYVPTNMIVPKLMHLKYHTTSNGRPIYRNFYEFLLNCDNLKTLDTQCMPQLPHDKFKFKLKEFHIWTRVVDLKVFENFIISQKETLKKLHIHDVELQDENLDVIFNQTKIEDLEVTGLSEICFKVPKTYNINDCIKKFSFRLGYRNGDNVSRILVKLGGLKHLDLMIIDRLDLVFTQVNFRNLKKLEMSSRRDENLNQLNFAQIQIESLEELRFAEIQN